MLKTQTFTQQIDNRPSVARAVLITQWLLNEKVGDDLPSKSLKCRQA